MARHVAVAAFLVNSHAMSVFNVARALAERSQPGSFFSFMATDATVKFLRASVYNVPTNLHFVTVPDGVTDDCSALPMPKRMEKFMAVAEAGGLKQWVATAEAAQGVKVSCLISDAFLWMAADVAEELDVPWVPIWVSSAASLLAHFHTDVLRQTIGTGDQAASKADDLLDCIQGLDKYRVRDLPGGIVTGDFNYVIHLLLHRMGKQLPRAKAIAVNSFPGLEPPETDTALATFLPAGLSIGPFHLLSSNSTNPKVSDPHGCISWLDRYGAGTVAYVAFGTVALLSPHELHELALGLEQSGAPFLWSLKEEAWPLLPPGFLDRNRDRGLVVGWTPQNMVIKHKAVGVFIMHAGWASAIEAITNAVPMACRPCFGDHFMNARSVAHVWGSGVLFDDDGSVITKDGVIKVIDVVLNGEQGKKMRTRAQEYKDMVVVQTCESNGGRMHNFDKLVNIVCGV